MTELTQDEVLARAKGKHLIVYDGVCGLCNGFIKFVINSDKNHKFVFTPLQSEIGKKVLALHGLDVSTLNTVYLVKNLGENNESVLSKSQAAFFVMQTAGGFLFQIIALGRLLGPAIGNMLYDMVAANRYKVFGKSDACMMPSPDVRERFLEL